MIIQFFKNLFGRKDKSQEEIKPLRSKILNLELLDKFIKSLCYQKIKQLEKSHSKQTLTKSELKRGLIFEKFNLTPAEKVAILSDDYSCIEDRLKILCDNEYYEEIEMMCTIFLVGRRNADFLFRKELDITQIPFKGIIYFFCVALLNTGKKVICQTYIELLQKLVIAYPHENNPPQDLIDKIGFRAHSNFFNSPQNKTS